MGGWVGDKIKRRKPVGMKQSMQDDRHLPYAALKPVLYHYKCTSELVNPTLGVRQEGVEGGGPAHLTLRPEYRW